MQASDTSIPYQGQGKVSYDPQPAPYGISINITQPAQPYLPRGQPYSDPYLPRGDAYPVVKTTYDNALSTHYDPLKYSHSDSLQVSMV